VEALGTPLILLYTKRTGKLRQQHTASFGY